MRVNSQFEDLIDDVYEPALLDDADLLVDAQPRDFIDDDDDDDDEEAGDLPDRFEYDRRSDRERHELKPIDEYSYFGAARGSSAQARRRQLRREHVG